MWISIGIAVTIIGVAYLTNGTQILYKQIKEKYLRAKRLHNIVKNCDSKQTWLMSITETARIIGRIWWIEFSQNLDQALRKYGRNNYELSYVINDNLYKIIIRSRRGPPKILAVIDENNNDISDIVRPYMGPNEDFHGHNFTPSFFDREKITIIYTMGDQKTFEKIEPIEIN